MSVGCKIVKEYNRPAPELIEMFKNLPVANIDDAMNRTAAVDASIEPVGRGSQLLGIAFTVRVPPGDNLMLHAAMDIAKPGDVIVIDAGGFTNRAIFGELMATYCKARGIKGIVCDGAVRDRKNLENMKDFRVYARAATPNGPYKNGPGEINVPVVIGGKSVCPGDIVVGDDDGVLFIKPNDAEAIARESKSIEEKESRILDRILSEGTYIRPWVEEKLSEIGCEIHSG